MTTTPATARRTTAMIASFADPGQRTTSAPFGHALARLAEERPEIVGLSADLAKYTDMHVFRDAQPDRFFQMGMAEQAMLGAAAGLAEVGLVPFASTYSVFATRRADDFLCLDIAEPGLNVDVVGAPPGLTTGYGPSHQATEDLAILRACPGLTIVDPCDAIDKDAAHEVGLRHGVPTVGVGCDVTDEAAVEAALTALDAAVPPVGALVNNAGITSPTRFLDVTDAEWDRIFAVNVRGAYNITCRLAPGMAERGFGRIVFLSSVSAERGGGVFGGTAYSAANVASSGSPARWPASSARTGSP